MQRSFPALAAQPDWLLQLPTIRATISALGVPVLDRAMIEEVFGVRRRRAIELLHRFGGYQVGKTFLVDRPSLLRQLEALEAGGEFRQERARRHRLSEDLERTEAALRARAAQAVIDLPNGAQLRPGELRIAFRDTEDLLRQLPELALAIQDDYGRSKRCASRCDAVGP